MIQQISDREYIIQGNIPLCDLNQELKLKLDTGDYDTLLGLLIGRLDFIPEDEHVPAVSIGDLHFEVLEVKDKRISKVLLRLPPKEHEET